MSNWTPEKPVGGVGQPAAPLTYHNPAAATDPNAWVPPNKMERFKALCRQHEISDFFAMKLRSLSGFEIVLIADDSGSMSTQFAPVNAFAAPVTRWDELKNSVSLIVSIAALFDDNGLDLYFLNRPPVAGITDPVQLAPVFASPPQGFTPTAAALQAVLTAKQSIMAEKKLLIIILTDGQPTDQAGNVNIQGVEQVLTHRNPQSYVTFVACTDDLSVMSYLNGWDQRIPKLDVVDDYLSEKREIQAARGPNFQFSYGDYIVKLLLGTIDPMMDKLDEKNPQQMNQPMAVAAYQTHNQQQVACCNIQ